MASWGNATVYIQIYIYRYMVVAMQKSTPWLRYVGKADVRRM